MDVTLLLLLLSASYCYFDGLSDAENLTITPSRLVVKYGDPASANCTSATPEPMGWEATIGGVSLTADPRTFLVWSVKKLTDYTIKPTCFLDAGKTEKFLSITVYKPPANVSISGPAGPLVEGQLYEFQCQVQDVAPASSLYVSFYKASTTSSKTEIASHPPNTTNSIKYNQSVEYPLQFRPSRGDNGARLWCSARLELGDQGPQPPPQMDSEHLNFSVLYKPQISTNPGPSLNISEGNTLSLLCQADGNPAPLYKWLPPIGPAHSNSVFTINNIATSHAGEYVCIATNAVGDSSWTVEVKVTGFWQTWWWIILVGVVAIAFLMGIIGLTYCFHYKHKRTGHYQLKDIFPRHRKKKLVKTSKGMDQSSV